MQITVYSKPACQACNATYRKVDALGLDEVTTIIDISEDPDAREFAMSLGHLEAPVVTVRDDSGQIVAHWGGYSPDKLKKAKDTYLVPAQETLVSA